MCIIGFPKFQWSWIELERVFNPISAHLMELDPGTGERYDWRFVHAKLGICNEKLISPIHYVEKVTPWCKIKVFDIAIEIENANTKSVHAWKARLNGRPYPNGTEFGMQPTWEENINADEGGEENLGGDTEMASALEVPQPLPAKGPHSDIGNGSGC